MSMPARVLIVGIGALAIIGGGATYASIPNDNGVFTACVTKSSGAVRLIDTERKPRPQCKTGEFKVRWNQAGKPGANGTNGTNGVSGYETVISRQDYPAESVGVASNFSATCPAGKKVIGGGAAARTAEGGNTTAYVVVSSSPTDDGTGWTATFDVDNSGLQEPYTLKIYAICAIVN